MIENSIHPTVAVRRAVGWRFASLSRNYFAGSENIFAGCRKSRSLIMNSYLLVCLPVN